MYQYVLVQQEPRGPSQTIEIPVNTNGLGRVQLPDIQQLRSTTINRIIIKGIRLVTLDVLTFGIISGLANATLAECKKISLVLYGEGWEKAQYIPLLEMNDVATPAGTFPYRNAATRFDNWENVDWSKSYLQYSNGTVSAGAPYCVMFDVEYIKLTAQGTEIQGPS